MNALSLQIVTPKGVFATSDEAASGRADKAGREVIAVTIPTQSGDIQVLPGHAELVTLLKPGVLSYTVQAGSSLVKMRVSAGSAQVRRDGSVLIIADKVEEAAAGG